MKKSAAGLKPPVSPANALLAFSLRGQSQALEEQAVAATPLLGGMCLKGQGTVLCAPPNAGKTLVTISNIIDAIDGGRIVGENVFYIDADDTTQGVAEKVKILDEYGVHVIAEGFNGFRAALMTPSLEAMIEDGSARDKLVVLDTFKKFTSPMSKVETSAFTEVLRRFVLSGGTLLCLAHTNKKTDTNGNNVFAGVSDIIDDLDCAYVLDVKPDIDGKRIVKFTNKKRRGNNPDIIMIAYSADPEITYVDRVASVHETDVYGGGDETPLDGQTSDEDIMESLGLAIRHGEHRGKMELIRMVASLHSVSKRRVLKLLEEATGNDSERHRWSYGVGARGLHVYKLLERDPPLEDA